MRERLVGITPNAGSISINFRNDAAIRILINKMMQKVLCKPQTFERGSFDSTEQDSTITHLIQMMSFPQHVHCKLKCTLNAQSRYTAVIAAFTWLNYLYRTWIILPAFHCLSRLTDKTLSFTIHDESYLTSYDLNICFFTMPRNIHTC